MEKLASRHAITELMSWISLMENIIEEDQDKIMGAVGSEVVQNFLQKYKVWNSFYLYFNSQRVQKLYHCGRAAKEAFFSYSVFLVTVSSRLNCISQGFRIDLTCKQLTVDFVNQSVLQISSKDVEGKRSDKTDFAEKLGAMNRRWQILQGLITEKVMFQSVWKVFFLYFQYAKWFWIVFVFQIQLLEGLLEGWLEHENEVQALKTWLTLQEEKVKKRHRIEDVASVQNALKDCQVCRHTASTPHIFRVFIMSTFLKITVMLLLQELEDLVKEKEKDLEKAEERGNTLIQDKIGAACSVVKETLKGLNQSWAHLDHMVSFLNPLSSWL